MARAASIAERQHRLFPNEMKATADLGGVYLARGDSDRAEPLLQTATKQQSKLYTAKPDAVLGDVYANLGEIALEKGRTQDAISQLQRAVDLAPTAARARFLLASAFALAGDLDRSGREIRAAFDVDSSAARAIDYMLLARTFKRAGNLTAAVDALETGARRFPSDIDVRLELADARHAQKHPVEALYDLLLARMLLNVNAPKTQVDSIASQLARLRTETETARSDPDPRLELMFSYLDDASTEQHDEALPTIRDLLARERSNPFVPRLLLARSLRATGRLAEAETVLTQLVAESPSSVPALTDLADLYFAENRRDAALRLVARAQQLAPDNRHLREVVEMWR